MSGSTFAWPAEAKNKYALAEHTHDFSVTQNFNTSYSPENHTHACSLVNHTHSYSSEGHTHAYIVDAARVQYPYATHKTIRFTRMDGSFFDMPKGLGTIWTHRSSGVAGRLYAVCGNDIIFVAVGASGIIVRSTDRGVSWSSVSSGTTADLRDVSMDGAYYAAVGDNGTLLYSTDHGATWALYNLSTNATLHSVLVLGTTFIIVGDQSLHIKGNLIHPNSAVITSLVIPESSSNPMLNLMLYDGTSRFLILGEATFTDYYTGIIRNNIAGTYPVSQRMRGCSNNDKFVFASNSTRLYYIKHDKITNNGISPNNGYLVNLTENTYIYNNLPLNSVCYCQFGDTYVAVGNLGLIVVFNDDLSAVNISITRLGEINYNDNYHLYDVCCDSRTFVAVGSTSGGAVGVILTSSTF